MSAAIPDPRSLNPMDAFIGQLLPEWLKPSSPAACRALHDAYRAYHGSLVGLQQAMSLLQDPQTFARTRLEGELRARLGLNLDLRQVAWRERRRVQRVPSYIFVSECVHVPALARLFGNFAAKAHFLPGSGLVEATGHRLLTSDLDAIARLCRDLDVGQAYQAHLSESMPASLLDRLAEHERHRLLLATEQARLEGVIDAVDAQSLAQVVSGQAPVHTASRWVESSALQVLGHEVTSALVFDLRGAWTPPPGLVDPLLTQGLILYLPHDGTGPIRRFDGWAALAQWLGRALGDRQWRDRFVQAIGLQTRSAFSLALAKRLKDPQVDPSPRSLALSTDPFMALALQLRRRLHDDALTLLVPTREFDRRQTLLRHAALTEAASGLLGLVGGFIPGVNELLLAQMAGQLLSGVFEGVVSWAQGHRHEAVDHLLGVAENLAANAVLAAGGQWVARGIQRAAHVDALQPILTEAGPRLWSGELTAFRDSVPETASLHANGLRHQAGHWWWEHTQQSFRVQQRTSGSWHLADPARPDSYGPELIHNGEHGWRLRYERPLEWSAAHEMLWRLWPAARALDAQGLQHVLQVAGLDAAHVRALWVEQQGVPFDLRETLQRFAVDQQVTALYQRLERVGADGLQPFATVLQHLGLANEPAQVQLQTLQRRAAWVQAWLFDDAWRQLTTGSEARLIHRDFPGLSPVFAQEVSRRASADQLEQMAQRQRLPLAMAEHARALLARQQANRMIEGLFLVSDCSAQGIELIFALLRRHAHWPVTINLEYRTATAAGQSSVRLYPQSGSALRVLVRQEPGVLLCDAQGLRLDEMAAPVSVFEALLQVLPAEHRQRLHWTGPQAALHMRQALQRWLPASRDEILRLVSPSGAQRFFRPPQRHGDGRIGYALSGRGRTGAPGERTARDRVRALFPALEDAEVDRYLDGLRSSPSGIFATLLQQEQALRSLDVCLRVWAEGTGAGAVARRRAAQAIRNCWQRIGGPAGGAHGCLALHLEGAALRQLPELPAQIQFPHVQALGLGSLGLSTLPERFLERFANLQRLGLSRNALTRVPPQIARLTHLRELRLEGNGLNFDSADVTVLAGLQSLEVLDLSSNSLSAAVLDVGQLSRLNSLYLRDCGLAEVPERLLWCGALARVDLRDNRIASLPESILQAPQGFRRMLRLERNPLPLETRQRLAAPHTLARPLPEVAQDRVRALWLERLDDQALAQRRDTWMRLAAEPGSDEFFRLLGELIDTRDFRQARAELETRVWSVLDAAALDSELRESVFDLAANDRTCVDSVMTCFNAIEVRTFLAQVVADASCADRTQALLHAGRRLFRLDQVEAFARRHAASRPDPAQVDEIEISLALRIGLAERLELPGQARLMQFEHLAGVSAGDLNEAFAWVTAREQGPLLGEYLTQRQFWCDHLRRLHAQAYTDAERPFWESLGALDERRDQMGALEYRAEVDTLAEQRRLALDALNLTLTRTLLKRG